MVVTLGTHEVTLTPVGGEQISINMGNVVDVEALEVPVINYGTTATTSGTGSLNVIPPSGPLTGGIPTQLQSAITFNYVIRMHFNDNRWTDLPCGKLTGGGATWVNTLVGANLGVTALKALYP